MSEAPATDFPVTTALGLPGMSIERDLGVAFGLVVRSMGLAKSVGVSNFSVQDMDEVLAVATVAPVVNQVQFSALKYRRALLDSCEKRDVVLEAYSPLGTGRHLSNKVIRQLAERVGRTPAQVLLRWCVQHGLPVIPKSTHRERIQENADIFSFVLSDEDMAALNGLDQTDGTGRALERTWW